MTPLESRTVTLRDDLRRAAENAKALAADAGDPGLSAFYRLIAEISSVLVQRCPGFSALPDSGDEKILEQQEAPTAEDKAGVERAVKAATELPPEV